MSVGVLTTVKFSSMDASEDITTSDLLFWLKLLLELGAGTVYKKAAADLVGPLAGLFW